MRSKANIKSHPIHPMLVAFPIAFFSGSFFFDLLGILLSKSILNHLAMYMNAAGVIGGLAAAVPGIIDYFFTIPPESSAKKRGMQHAIINSINLLLFVFIFFYRRSNDVSLYLITGLELLGLILVSIAGWLGGSLVYRNQIGVDPRYANAGKWTEKFFKNEGGLLEVASTKELKLNQMQLLHIGSKRIVLALTENGYTAFEDHCSHKGGSLAGGSIICSTVQCPWHGSQFNAMTGEVKAGPAKSPVQIYSIIEKNEKLYLDSTVQINDVNN